MNIRNQALSWGTLPKQLGLRTSDPGGESSRQWTLEIDFDLGVFSRCCATLGFTVPCCTELQSFTHRERKGRVIFVMYFTNGTQVHMAALE